MAISKISDLDPNGYYTYEDYLTWTFPERVKLFKGKPFEISPAPNRRHQKDNRKVRTLRGIRHLRLRRHGLKRSEGCKASHKSEAW